MITILKDYKPKKESNKNKKDVLVINAQNFYDGREMIVSAFKNETFPFYSGNYYYDLEEEETSESEDEKSDDEESEKDSVSKLEKLAIDADKILDHKLVDKYFHRNSLKEIVEQVKDFRCQNKTSAEYNNKMALLIAGLIRLENVIKNMPEDEVKNKGLDLLKNIVRKIVDPNQILDDLPPSETEKEAAERQKGQGLKILTPQQMFTRLPILLAQLKAGNNTQRRKNEIRQLLYSLYRSKNLSKKIYNSLMNTI